MAFCKTEQGSLYYEVQGKGEALLILRGLGRSSRYWLGFDQLLAKSFKVIQVDMRGLGRSKCSMQWSDSVETLADDCLAVLNHLKVKKVHIFGLSLGGMVALSFGARHPSRCKSLIVANSSSADYLGLRMYPRAIQNLLIGQIRGRLQASVLGLTIPTAIAKVRGPEILEAWEKINQSEGMPLETIAKQVLAAGRFRIRGKLDARDLPTLFLNGSLDELVPPRNSHKLQSLVPGSKIKTVKGAGHEIQTGHEQQVQKILSEFCSQAARKK